MCDKITQMLKSADPEMIKLGAKILQEGKPENEWQNILRECQRNKDRNTGHFEYIIRRKGKNSIIKIFPKKIKIK